MKRRLPLLLSATALVFLCCLFLPQCSERQEKEATPGRLIRLLDHFDEIRFLETPFPLQVAGESSRARESTAPSPLAELIDGSPNRDGAGGSSPHPYKLKVTKSSSGDFTTGVRTQNVILAPAPTTFAFSRRLAGKSTLSFGYGVLPQGQDYLEGDFHFQIEIEDPKTGSGKRIFSRTLSPASKKRHRMWIDGRIDLENTVHGKAEGRFIFRTTASVDADAALPLCAWVNPTWVEEEQPANRLNVILISIDTLRADHLGCYGYYRDTSPHLDRLAREGVRFDWAVSQAPYTLPSHMSLLTSLYPSFHKVNRPQENFLNPRFTTLAEILYQQGYRTWAITGGGQISKSYGFADGFETYIEYTSGQRDTAMKVGETIRFLDRERKNNFLVFFHSYQTHAPYTPRPPYDTRFGSGYRGTVNGELDTIEAINQGRIEVGPSDLERIVSLYDGEIRETDEALGELFTYLRENDLESKTLVVFTSDHGEEFGEHGRVGTHSRTLYDEVLRVPLIFKLPGRIPRGVVVEEQVQLVDVLPTILDLAGVDYEGSVQGRALTSWMSPGSRDRHPIPALSERLAADENMLRSVRKPGYKLISRHNRKSGEKDYLFFDLEKDPGEQMATELSPDLLGQMMEELRFLMEEETDREPEGRRVIDAETLEALRKLGYVQ